MTTKRKTSPPPEKETKASYDHTITKRSTRFRERVRDAAGKRITLALNEVQADALRGLVVKGYADTESEAVRQAILDTWKSVGGRTKKVAPSQS